MCSIQWGDNWVAFLSKIWALPRKAARADPLQSLPQSTPLSDQAKDFRSHP